MFELSRQGAVDIVSGNEPLNVEYVEAVKQLFDRCSSHGQPRIIFDLADVPLVDSAGLELLLDTRETCLLKGGQLILTGATPLVRDILRVSGLQNRFESFNDVASAVGSFAI